MAPKRKKKPSQRGPKTGIQIRRAADRKSYEFLFPPGVRERTEDMEEVHAMLAAGETEIAVDELRWLLGGCHELLEGHQLLGKIAEAAGDRELARAHFGYAFQLGADALPRRGLDHPLPYSNPVNRAFHQAGAGLVRVLVEMGESSKAQEVAKTLLALDPVDPLEVKKICE